ncbi:MAG: hypothetical protein ACK5II_04615 [Paracoccus sp. (in: a-proteobacteria)]
MIRKLLPVLALLLVVTAGLLGGEYLRPEGGKNDISASAHDGQTDETADGNDDHAASKVAGDAGWDPGDTKPDGKEDAKGQSAGVAHYRFPSQFFVPVMRGDQLNGMMVLTLTVEMPAALEEDVYKLEFRLRDAFLRTLLIQANTGGFDGNYTTEPRMRRLREALMKTADEVSDGIVTDVLIEDIARQ